MKRKRKPIQMLAHDLGIDLRTIAEVCQSLNLPPAISPSTTFTVSECESIVECVQSDELAERALWLDRIDRLADHVCTAEVGATSPRSVVDEPHLDGHRAAKLFLEQHSLEAPEEVLRILAGNYPSELTDLIYSLPPPDSNEDSMYDILWAMDALNTAVQSPPPELLPLMPVDDRSFACVVCSQRDSERPSDFGKVVRWHLDDVPERGQRQLLDVSSDYYLNTVVEDLRAREKGLQQLGMIVKRYERQFVKRDKRPRHWNERPIRLAVQNVVIGHAALLHDDTTNALSCSVWQSCQVPHVAAHEGTRALAALTLGQAFSYGGTMEIRFDRHAEGEVPAVLRQFARVWGIKVGAEDEKAIHPREARQLMWAVTEMPDALRERLKGLTREGHLTPERACFILLSGIWLPIELDFLAAISARLPSILRGATDPLDRMTRQAELAVCRAAHMLGILFNVFSAAEDNAEEAVNVREDRRNAVSWEVVPEVGAARLRGVRGRQLPDLHNSGRQVTSDTLLVFPRQTAADCNPGEVRGLASIDETVAFLTPFGDAREYDGVLAVQCPDTLEAIDRAIESRLLKSRVGRA